MPGQLCLVCHLPRCSWLCLFVTVYLSLFAIAGFILFSSLFRNRTVVNRNFNTVSSRNYGSRNGILGLGTEFVDNYHMWLRAEIGNKSDSVFPRSLNMTGLRWPYNKNTIVNCSMMHEIIHVEYIASGWTKAVYKGLLHERLVAVKTVNMNGHDILMCLQQLETTPSECYQKAAAKVVREIILLTELAHDNVVEVIGFCIPDEFGPVSLVTEFGEPLDTMQLLQFSWEDRLHIALDIARIVHHLAHSPLGSLSMNDFRHQQFVLVNGVLKLSDVDDLGIGEPWCETDKMCQKFAEKLIYKKGKTARNRISVCLHSQCKGHNELLNIWHAGEHFIKLLLPLSAPVYFKPHIQEMVNAYSLQHNSSWYTLDILQATEFLVQSFISGDYITSTSTLGSLGFEKFKDSDFPGMYDYRCKWSTSTVSCVVSVISEEEAASICSQDSACKAVVLSNKHTWTDNEMAVEVRLSTTTLIGTKFDRITASYLEDNHIPSKTEEMNNFPHNM